MSRHQRALVRCDGCGTEVWADEHPVQARKALGWTRQSKRDRFDYCPTCSAPPQPGPDLLDLAAKEARP